MCGRFTLAKPQALPAAFPQFRFAEFSETRLPRYNIAPAQEVLGVRNDGRDRIEPLRWGVHGRINIRAESIAARRGAGAPPLHRVRRWILRVARATTVLLYAAFGRTVRFCRSLGARQRDRRAATSLLAVRTHWLPRCTTGCRSSFRGRVWRSWLDPEPLPAELAGSTLAAARGRVLCKCARSRGESITRTTMRLTCLATRTLLCSESA